MQNSLVTLELFQREGEGKEGRGTVSRKYTWITKKKRQKRGQLALPTQSTHK